MFLPEDYKSPSSQNNYMKLQDGENKFRILSAPILGWEDWDNKTPVRFRFADKPLTSFDPKKPVRHFWAFIVFNYKEERIQILHLTQATVRKAIETLSKDADWGAPYFYDLKIFKTGKDKETEYTVNPLPHKEVHQFIIDEFNAKPCLLEALFDNADPFAPWMTKTPGVFTRGQEFVKTAISSSGTSYITSDQAQQLKDEAFQDINSDEAVKVLLQKCACSSLDTIPADKYIKCLEYLQGRLEKQKKEMNEVPF